MNNPKSSHLLAPFTSLPIRRVKITNKIDIINAYEIKKEMLEKRKRVKNVVPLFNRCCA